METIVKQRVIGAVVLVALAVIFIPALLEGPDEEPLPETVSIPPSLQDLRTGEIQAMEPPPSMPMEAPESPNAVSVAEGFENTETITLNLPPRGVTGEAAPGAAVPETASETASNTAQESPAPGEPAATVPQAAEEIPLPNTRQTPAIPAPTGEPAATEGSIEEATTTAPVPKEKEVPPPAAQSGWVVQVGAFSKESNAVSLRDRLRKAGYSVFVETLKRSSGDLYRVRVGPETERSRADTLQQKLAQETGQQGKVMRHP